MVVRLLTLMCPFPSGGPCFLFGEKEQNWAAITRYISLILSVYRHIFHITISFDFHYDSEEDIITFNICCPQFTDGENEAHRRQSVLPKATQPGSDPDGIQAEKFWLQSPPLFLTTPVYLDEHLGHFLLHKLMT